MTGSDLIPPAELWRCAVRRGHSGQTQRSQLTTRWRRCLLPSTTSDQNQPTNSRRAWSPSPSETAQPWELYAVRLAWQRPPTMKSKLSSKVSGGHEPFGSLRLPAAYRWARRGKASLRPARPSTTQHGVITSQSRHTRDSAHCSAVRESLQFVKRLTHATCDAADTKRRNADFATTSHCSDHAPGTLGRIP